MPMLHPCPRCTQALPASARFCRRCGTAVGAMVTPAAPPVPRSKPRSLLTAGLAAMVLGGVVILTFLFHMSPPRASTRMAPTLYTSPGGPFYPVQPSVVPQPQPPVVIVPESRIRDEHLQERAVENTGADYRRQRDRR